MNEPYDNVVAALNEERKRRKEAEAWASKLYYAAHPQARVLDRTGAFVGYEKWVCERRAQS